MQIELSLDDLRDLNAACVDSPDIDDDLMERLKTALAQAEEMDDMDFNECEGGACKL